MDYIDAYGSIDNENPLFLYLALNTPHQPVIPADFSRGKSEAGSYGDYIWETDWAVGQVLEAIDRNKLSENTLLIYTSDNGSTIGRWSRDQGSKWNMGDHDPHGGLRGTKGTSWEGGHRIPFVARWPRKIKPGSESRELICINDMFRTFAALVGAELPDDAGVDSENILPALMDQKPAHPCRKSIIHAGGSENDFAVREGKWKLIPDKRALFDMDADWKERNNLYDQNPEIVVKLETLFETQVNEGRSTPGKPRKNDPEQKEFRINLDPFFKKAYEDIIGGEWNEEIKKLNNLHRKKMI